jgi:hypothetical protein
MHRVLVYIGSLHDELDRETIEYCFHDPTQMVVYISKAEKIVKDKGMYFSYIIEEIKLEEEIEENINNA